MLASMVSLVLGGIAIVVAVNGLIGLRAWRHRFAPGPLVDPVCPRCRYTILDGFRSCSECGADLAVAGVRDASWPRRRDFIVRATLAAMACLPWAMAVASIPPAWLPAYHQVREATVLAIAGQDGVPSMALMVDAKGGWFGRGIAVAAEIPDRVRRTAVHAIPPSSEELAETHPSAALDATSLQAVFGEATWTRMPRESLDGAALAALPLADEIVAAPLNDNVAGRLWRDSDRSFGGGRRTDADGRPRASRSIEIDTYGYWPLQPGTVVPISRRTLRSVRVLLPPAGAVAIVAGAVLLVLLVRGVWLARRFRPVPPAALTPPVPAAEPDGDRSDG